MISYHRRLMKEREHTINKKIVSKVKLAKLKRLIKLLNP